jgi:hypothetical protein
VMWGGGGFPRGDFVLGRNLVETLVVVERPIFYHALFLFL